MSLLLFRAVPSKRVDDQCVVHIDHDGYGGIHRGECFDGQHRLKERPPLSAVLLRDFDPHQTECEQFPKQILPQLAGFVHGADVRSNLRGGKLAHGFLKHLFFVCEYAQRLRGLHHCPYDSLRASGYSSDSTSQSRFMATCSVRLRTNSSRFS